MEVFSSFISSPALPAASSCSSGMGPSWLADSASCWLLTPSKKEVIPETSWQQPVASNGTIIRDINRIIYIVFLLKKYIFSFFKKFYIFIQTGQVL